MSDIQQAVLAAGCFWGLQDLMRHLPGVLDTEAGYTGGDYQHPTWRLHPGHAEAVRIEYDPIQITYEQLLDYFFRIHNPTTLNKQGNDVGSSYRSAIFYASDQERQAAADFIKRVNTSGQWKNPVVTTLEPLDTFWRAEEEHQDFLLKHPGGYTCHYEQAKSYLD